MKVSFAFASRFTVLTLLLMSLMACGTSRPASDANRVKCSAGEALVCEGRQATRLGSDDPEYCRCVAGDNVDRL